MLQTTDAQLLSGVFAALFGAVNLSVGTHLQNAGVGRASQIGRSTLSTLVRDRSWAIGTVVLGLAIVLQLIAVLMAPVSVVQPIGIVALVVSVAIRHACDRRIPSRRVVWSVILAVSGLGAFVLIAGRNASPSVVTSNSGGVMLALFAGALALVLPASIFWARRHPLIPVTGAGILFGFVITLVKLTLGGGRQMLESERAPMSGDLYVLFCALAATAAFVIGSYLVQVAHRTARADLVMGGLTVVDPLVAAALGIGILHELEGAPTWVSLALLGSGAIAVAGVYSLSRTSALTGRPSNRAMDAPA